MVLRLSLHKNSHESKTCWSPLSYLLSLCLLLWLFLLRRMLLILQAMTSYSINTFGAYESKVVIYVCGCCDIFSYYDQYEWQRLFTFFRCSEMGVVVWLLFCPILWNFSMILELSCSCYIQNVEVFTWSLAKASILIIRIMNKQRDRADISSSLKWLRKYT